MAKLRGTPAIRVGGRYGVNVETLTGDITLTPGKDYIYQHLNPEDADRVITLNTANAKVGDRFFIMHNGNWDDVNYLDVQVGGTSYDKIYVGIFKAWIFDGSDWLDAWTGTSHGASEPYRGIGIGRNAQDKECGVAIGPLTNAVLDGVAIGYLADAHDYGVSIGYDADGDNKGVGVGWCADGHDLGVAIGYKSDAVQQGIAIGYYTDTNGKIASIALGFYSKNTRHSELAMNIGDFTGDWEYQNNQIIIGGWSYRTTNNTPTEIYGTGSFGRRFTIRPASSLAFNLIVTGRDNTSGDVGTYMFRGLIKRDGANNTVLVDSSSYYVYEENPLWDCVIAADDTNEALKITVTGQSNNEVRWAARLDGVETSFSGA